MKRYILPIIISAVSLTCWGQQASTLIDEVTNIETVSQNRVYPRTTFMTYSKKEKAMVNIYSDSEFYQDLDGKWKFLYLKDASLRDEKYLSTDFDDSSWVEITVPANWEMQGVQKALYADSVYEFAFDRQNMVMTQQNPMGIYRTRFKVPYIWEERQIFLHIGAVKSGAVVYVNGQKIGYGEDSKTPYEYDITRYVKEGYNNLTIEVYNHSSGSFLEAGAGWKLSGINRSVYVYTQPKVCIRDFTIRTTLNPEKTDAMLELGVITKSHYLNQKNVKVFYDLIAPDGKTVSYESRSARLRMRLEDTVYFAIPVHRVKKWSAETPNQYTLLMRVQRDNRFTEAVKFMVGFREVDYSGERLLVNGKAIKLKGVVYGEHNPYTGTVVSESRMETDLSTMKKLGINAIRTEHPMPHYFYELCDSIGFYVYDVANITSKPMGKDLSRGGTLANNQLFRDSHIERVVAAHQNSKNYASVIMMAMGIDAGNGYNFYKAYQRVKTLEHLRPIVYEGASKEWNSDVAVPMNLTLKEIETLTNEDRNRPYIISSIPIGSDLKQKWEAIFASDNIQGGFIDSWQVKALPSSGGGWVSGSENKKTVVAADGSLTPTAETIKELFDPFVISFDRSTNELTIDNRTDFVNLSEYRVECSVESTEKTIASGSFTMDAKPGAKGYITINELLSKGGNKLIITIKDNESGIVLYNKIINLK